MLSIQSLSVAYQERGSVVQAMSNVSVEIPDREFVAFVGPSGCGKTTLLRCIAGILKPTAGEVLLDGKLVNRPSTKIGMVFQDLSLFPWLTVRGNIEFGLKLSNTSSEDLKRTVEHYLEITGLKDSAHLYPRSLSGGMKQRVAIARTLANDPDVILMDEPFASLDSLTREAMQEFLTGLWEGSQKTVVFVTHDVGEAIFLANTVHVLTKSPASIKNSFPVKFERPRKHALKHSKEFFDLKNTVLDTLEKG